MHLNLIIKIKMKNIKILTITIFLLFSINIKAQKIMEITFMKEIVYNDTCIRFYKITNFNSKDKNVWYNIAENLYNIVLNTPKNRNIGDKIIDPDYYTSCDNVVFYCYDSTIDSNLLTINNLNNNDLLKSKIICKHFYNQLGDLIIDPFNYGYYRKKQ